VVVLDGEQGSGVRERSRAETIVRESERGCEMGEDFSTASSTRR
jgi:hypothetical protein